MTLRIATSTLYWKNGKGIFKFIVTAARAATACGALMRAAHSGIGFGGSDWPRRAAPGRYGLGMQ